MDLENLLGGEPRLEILPQAGENEPNANGPEDEPLADQRRQRSGAVHERMLDCDRADGGREHEAKDNREIHPLLPLFGARGALRRWPRSGERERGPRHKV